MSRKKDLKVLLPELNKISIYQSNRVTNAKYDFTMLQQRVFVWVMYHMQYEIKKVMNGTPVGQLALFHPDIESEYFMMNIPLSFIGRTDQYTEIRQQVEKLATIAVRMQNDKKDHTIVTGLFAAIKLPGEGKRSPDLTIQMRKDVAQMLIHVDRAGSTPIRYTSYMLHVAATCRNKYTARIYIFLSSKRDLGGYRIALQDLRDMLQLADTNYANYNDFKRFVLLPVQEELKETGDIWFNCGNSDFEVKDGKKVVMLNFKIIKHRKEEGITDLQITQIKKLLKTLFHFTDYHYDKIQPIFTANTDFEAITDKIEFLDRYVKEHKRSIETVAPFVVKSLLAQFTAS